MLEDPEEIKEQEPKEDQTLKKESAEKTAQFPLITGGENDSYWAQLLKEKAALELGLDDLKDKLSVDAVEIVELKKQNSDLQLELNKLSNLFQLRCLQLQL